MHYWTQTSSAFKNAEAWWWFFVLFFLVCYFSCYHSPGPVLDGRVQRSGPGHRGLGQTMEEVCGVWVSGKREIPAGVEEQDVIPETVHDEGPEAWPHDVRCQVRSGATALLLDLYDLHHLMKEQVINTTTSGFLLIWLNICTSPFAAVCFSLPIQAMIILVVIFFSFFFICSKHALNFLLN